VVRTDVQTVATHVSFRGKADIEGRAGWPLQGCQYCAKK